MTRCNYLVHDWDRDKALPARIDPRVYPRRYYRQAPRAQSSPIFPLCARPCTFLSVHQRHNGTFQRTSLAIKGVQPSDNKGDLSTQTPDIPADM